MAALKIESQRIRRFGIVVFRIVEQESSGFTYNGIVSSRGSFNYPPYFAQDVLYILPTERIDELPSPAIMVTEEEFTLIEDNIRSYNKAIAAVKE